MLNFPALCFLAVLYSTQKDVDEGLRLGDYPVLPWRSAQEERPVGWWDNQDRRDKETPVRRRWSQGTLCVQFVSQSLHGRIVCGHDKLDRSVAVLHMYMIFILESCQVSHNYTWLLHGQLGQRWTTAVLLAVALVS